MLKVGEYYRERDYTNLGKLGKVLEFTKVMNAPSKYKDMEPYYLALLEVEGRQILGMIVDTDELTNGAQVRGVVRKMHTDDLIHYGIKWVIQ